LSRLHWGQCIQVMHHIRGRVAYTTLTHRALISRFRRSGYFRKSRALLTHACNLNSIKTIASITLLFQALVLNPQVQKRAQAELDAVVGRDRLPTFDDRPRLSYIEAICREVLRWQVITPIGSTIPYQLHKAGGEMCRF
jgi:hypothetical protein